MFDKRRVITGLETGTTKIRVAVGEQNDAGAVNIIHVGEAESNGVVKGEIVNARVAIEDIRNALQGEQWLALQHALKDRKSVV